MGAFVSWSKPQVENKATTEGQKEINSLWSRAVLPVAVLILLLLAMACGTGPSGLGDDGLPDGGRNGGLLVRSGDLDVTEDLWIQLGAAWNKAMSAATQMVVAVNGLVFFNVEVYGIDIKRERLDTALKSLDVLEQAGQKLSFLVDSIAATGSEEVNPSQDELSLSVRHPVVIKRLRRFSSACLAEASRVRALLEPLSADSLTNAILDQITNELATAPDLLIAAGPVLASAGAVTRVHLPVQANISFEAEKASLLLSFLGEIPVVSASVDANGQAGAVPSLSDSPQILLWRGDALSPSAGERAVAVDAGNIPLPELSMHTLSFPKPTEVALRTRPLAENEACWLSESPSPQLCGLGASGLLPPGRYLDRGGENEEVESEGLSASVARRMASGLSNGELVMDLPEDNEIPAPQITSMSPQEGPVGTTITLLGKNFGWDIAAVSLDFNCGQTAVALPSSLSDTSLTVVFPQQPLPSSYGPWWCTYRSERFQDCGIRVWVRGRVAWAGYFRLLDLPACKILTWYDPRPSVLSVGDTFSVYGKGFSPDPKKNVARFAGGVLAKASLVEPNEYEEELRTVYFSVPEGAVSGPVVFRNLDGVDMWSDPINLEIVPPTIPELLSGPSAGGLHIPCAVLDAGRPTQWNRCYSYFWVLGHKNADKLDWDTDCPGVKLKVVVETGLGSIELPAVPLDGERLLIPLTTEIQPNGFYGINYAISNLQVGDTITIRLMGRERVNGFWRTSAPLVLPVISKAEIGTYMPIDAGLQENGTSPIKVALGDALVFEGLNCDSQLTAPGLWEGAFSAKMGLVPSFPCWEGAACVKTLRVVPTTSGIFTLTNEKGISREIHILKEGTVASAALEVYDFQQNDYVPVPHLAEDGGILGCGGVRVEIPRGALPLHDGSGEYRVSCRRSPLEKLGLSELTAGGLQTSVFFEPEPPLLLKPITITIPFDPDVRATEPELGLYDPQSGLYANLPATREGDRLRLEVPAGTYGDTSSSAGVPPSSKGLRFLNQLSINQLLSSLIAAAYRTEPGVLRDETRQLQINYVATPGEESYVTDAYAGEVLAAAQAAWDFMVGQGWPKPDGWLGGWVVLTITNMGPANETKGSTTKGVFGQPWVMINSNLPSGSALATTTAHEMGHVFQRQVNNVFTFKWIDEAAAQWTAVGTLGSYADVYLDVQSASEFPTVSIPTTFGSGYNEDQAYAAGVLAVWLEQVSPGSMLRIYQKLRDDYLAYLDARGTLSYAANKSINVITYEFAEAYWSQQLELVKNIVLLSPHLSWTDWSGVTFVDERPPLSSRRWDLDLGPKQNEMVGRDLVVRTSGMNTGQFVNVYRDQALCNLPGSGMVLVKALSPDTPKALLEAHRADTNCYRVLVVNFDSRNSANVNVKLVAPQIESFYPTQGGNSGGYPITLYGKGFGDVPGAVLMFGVNLNVTNWSDTSITATMFNAGTMTGPVNMYIRTAEGARSNEVIFTLTN